MKSLEEQSIEVIKRIEYINISTISPEGEPWGSPVYTAYDNDLCFYWLSWKENQHSKNIHNNPNAFVTIYDSTVPCSTGIGVYFSGKAEKITNVIELAKCLINFYMRRNRSPRDVKQFLTKYPRRMYKFTPIKAWMNGDSEIEGNFIDIREELSLDKLKKLIKS